MSATSETPPQGTPTIPADEQAVYDAGQDARLREHSAQLQAIRAEVTAGQDARIRALRRFVYVAFGVIGVVAIFADAVAFSLARRPAPPPAPAVHVTAPACPAAPACPPCAACPACPAPRSHRRDR